MPAWQQYFYIQQCISRSVVFLDSAVDRSPVVPQDLIPRVPSHVKREHIVIEPAVAIEVTGCQHLRWHAAVVHVADSGGV